jgi:hypothetical protein
MDKELKAKWLEALRSGKYGQAQGQLREVDETYDDVGKPEYTYTNKFCCLGVLVDTIDPNGWHKDAAFASHRRGRQGDADMLIAKSLVKPEDQDALAGMNDDGKTFHEIADYIEKTL